MCDTSITRENELIWLFGMRNWHQNTAVFFFRKKWHKKIIINDDDEAKGCVFGSYVIEIWVIIWTLSIYIYIDYQKQFISFTIIHKKRFNTQFLIKQKICKKVFVRRCLACANTHTFVHTDKIKRNTHMKERINSSVFPINAFSHFHCYLLIFIHFVWIFLAFYVLTGNLIE